MFWRPEINPDKGPFKVELRKGEFIDEDRSARLVPYKIYYPVAHNMEKVPIIIWSHGFGGNRDGAAFLSRFVAEHGYIVVHITHIGTDSTLWEGKDGHPWDILKKHKVKRETTLSRFADVPFALDRLKIWADEHPEAGKYMDFDHIGISGHSFGALTTQVMAGMLFPNKKEELTSYREERFKAGILYSPVTISHLGPDEAFDASASDSVTYNAYNSIDIPLMHMTGTDDSSPINGEDYRHRLVVYEHSGHPEKYLLVKKGGDHMVYNGTRGKLAVNEKRELHENHIKIGSLAFWDAYLKEDKSAMEWLKTGFQEWLADEADLKH